MRTRVCRVGVGLAAAVMLLAGCSIAPPQPQPSPPAYSAQEIQRRLELAEPAFAQFRSAEVISLLSGINTVRAQTLLILSYLDTSAGRRPKPEEVAEAKRLAAVLSQVPEARLRGLLLSFYVADPALRTPEWDQKLSDSTITEGALRALYAGYLSRQGMHAEALAEWQAVEKTNPANPRAVGIQIFHEAIATENWTIAHDYAYKIEELPPRSFRFLIDLSNVPPDLEGGTISAPPQTDTLGYLIELNHARDDVESEIADFQEYTRKYPSDVQGWFALAHAYITARELGAGRDAVNRGLALNSAEINGLRLQLYLDSKESPLNKPLMMRRIKRLLDSYPRDTVVNNIADLIQSAPEIVERRSGLLLRNAQDKENRNLLAQALVANREFAKALEVIQPLYEQEFHDFRTANVYATILASLGQVTEAKAIYDGFIGVPPAESSAAASTALGQMYVRLGRQELAAQAFQQAVEQYPEGEVARRYLGDLYFSTGNFDRAIEVYQEIDILTKGELTVRRRLIEAYLRGGKDDLAAPLIDEVLKKNPKDVQALILKAFAALKREQFDTAFDALNVVLQNDPKNSVALYYRALCWSNGKHDADKAIGDLEAAHAVTPGALNVGMYLAQLYAEKHRDDDAAKLYDKLLATYPPPAPENATIRAAYLRFRNSRRAEAPATLPAP